MPRKRPPLSRILLIVAALAVGLALFQITRHGLEADALASDARRGPSAPACSPARTQGESPDAASGATDSAALTLRLDYAGAESLLDALERDSLSEADVDSLFRIRGLCAMVDNVPRFFPGVGAPEFRKDLRTFVRTRKGDRADRYFRLGDLWRVRAQVRSLLAAIRANERAIVAGTIARLEPYRPDSAPLAVTARFVAGGVSDGFAFENEPGSFYANLANAGGDLNGVVLNMAHEAYHVMQFRAQERAGLNPAVMATDATPPVERLFATTLTEGTANWVIDPTRWEATGPNVESSRARYRRNAEPRRIAANFARFDDVLARLRDRRIPWDAAYTEGFSSVNDASFYFVGYEMARALERYCGRECIGRSFAEQPVEFFRRYIAMYREHPEIAGRFSPATEAFVAQYGARSTR